MKGSIVRVQDKGFGFIKPVEGENDVFFHASALVDITFDDLKEGDMVTFEVEEGPKGPAATNVQRAEGEAAAAPVEEAEAPVADATEAEAPAAEETPEETA